MIYIVILGLLVFGITYYVKWRLLKEEYLNLQFRTAHEYAEVLKEYGKHRNDPRIGY